jgi:hypothetical protein
MDFSGWTPWVAIAISLAAFFRPNVSRWLRVYFNEAQFIPSARVEVGFSQFGPTIGLLGALRVAPNDQFVEQITHNYNWAVNRGVSLPPNNPPAQYMTGIAIKAYQSISLNIQFHDQDSRAKLDLPANRFIEAWNKFLENNSVDRSSLRQEDRDKHFEDFLNKEKDASRLFFQEIIHEFYWQAGQYELEILIHTIDPKKLFRSSIMFSLTEGDVEQLRNNQSALLRVACGASTNFNFAYANFRRS